ncbi:MAG: tryptophan synthase subunit alpha [Muribaculaceae bacterium]|nr:tryptophan synthase subunit alpha [Muribaculaceae bacterium]
MNRLQSLFERKPENILSIYFTAGYPTLESVGEIINSLVANGVDMIEVGVPFSDPMADGPVIQESSTIALRNGMTLRRLLDDVKAVRANVPETPLVLMGYLNPLMRMGIRNLFERCAEAGIDAMIVPDLPFDIYLSEFRELCREFDIPMIMLITPETSPERVRLIDEHCDGFIYMVSSASTTGTRDSFGDSQLDYFHRINSMNLNHKRLIGFGISNARTLADAQANASGAIIGSKFIKCLAATPTDIPAAVTTLLHSLQN